MGSVNTLAPLCGDTYSKPIEFMETPNVKPRAIMSQALIREGATTSRKTYTQASGNGRHPTGVKI